MFAVPPSSTAWLTKAVLLTTAHDTTHGDKELDTYYFGNTYVPELEDDPPEDSRMHVLTLDATYEQRNRFYVSTSDQLIEAFTIDIDENDYYGGGHLYLAAHSGCILLAQYFI